MVGKDLFSESVSNKNIINFPLKDISPLDINPRKSGLILSNITKLVSAEDFPEIHIGYLDGEYIVVDGYHRLSAARQLGRGTIKAFITEYSDISEIKKDAFIANVNHGMMLSELDIALNMYEFYVTEKAKNSNVSIRGVVTEYSVTERRGRSLLIWAVITQEVLGDKSYEIDRLSKYEYYFKLITDRKEKIGEISSVFKEDFKRFYIKYDHLSITELKKAIDYHIEGKDYFEEMKEEAEGTGDAKAFQEEGTPVYMESNDDGSWNVTTEDGNEFPAYEYNEVIEDAYNKGEKITAELIEKNKETERNFSSATQHIRQISELIMTMRFQQSRKRLEFTKEDYTELNNLQDRIEEIINDIDSSKFSKGDMF